MTRNALGRGLNALIRSPEPTVVESAPAPVSHQHPTTEVAIDLIDPNPYQPRVQFRQEALQELANSILAEGIIQPLVLRRNGQRYQIIAGERRWRAAQLAGLTRVPAVVREIPETQAL